MWYDEKERWDQVFERVHAAERAEMQRRLHEAAARRHRKADTKGRPAEPQSDGGHGFWDRIKHLVH